MGLCMQILEKGINIYRYVNIHTLISCHKFQLILFKVKDSLKLCSLVLDLLKLHFLLCLADISLPENRDTLFFYLSQYRLNAWVSLKRSQCILGSELVVWDLDGISSVWAVFCSGVSTDAFLTEISVALSSYWSRWAVQYDKLNWPICRYSSMLFSSYFSIFIFFRLIVDGNMVFPWMKIQRLTH